ncbi:MAG: hypothetical protein QOF90_76 [Acetobacteraceae bacterium]|nr:hypothetical protein [Acetobacteraceae bacterium]
MTVECWRILLAGCAVIATVLPALGQKPSFAELLSRAEAQAAAGHRWAPPGDNMTDTVIGMLDLIPTATPEQLTELSELLDSEKESPRPRASGAAPSTKEPVTKEPGTVVATPSSDTRSTTPTTGPATAMAAADRPTPPSSGTFAATPAPPANDTAMAAQPNPPTATPPAADTATAAPARSTPPANTAMVLAVRPTPPAEDTAVAEPARPVPWAAAPVAARPGSRAMELFARGQQAERQGDIFGARRLYSKAAQQGHAMAARNLGRLYDPVYLGQIAVGGNDADPAIARQWYERALAMGDAEAGPLVQALSLR